MTYKYSVTMRSGDIMFYDHVRAGNFKDAIMAYHEFIGRHMAGAQVDSFAMLLEEIEEDAKP